MALPELLQLLKSPDVLAAIHDEAHAALKSNQCAYTASLLLRKAKLLTDKYQNTGGLHGALLKKGWAPVFYQHELLPGDVCFSCDCEGMAMPDHVYMFVKHGKAKRTAVVYDNYSHGLHERNLGKGMNTPLAYALRAPK